MEEIQGTVKGKIFESADGYAVIEIEGSEPIVVVGHMPYVRTGELTRFFGEYKTHPRFGRQFACTGYESIQPVAREDMITFLASDFVKGLGSVLAERLVDAFGEQTFEVIEKHPERLDTVRGVSRKLAQALHETFMDYADSKNRYAELMGLGLSARQAVQAAAELGGDAAAMIRNDPFVLVGKVRGIDFKTADRLAADLGMAPDSPMRVERAILHVLKKTQTDRGDMCVPRQAVVHTVCRKLDVAPELVDRCLQGLCLQRSIVIRDAPVSVFGPQATGPAVFLQSAYQTETECAAMLLRIAHADAAGALQDPPPLPVFDLGEGLSEEQAEAVRGMWYSTLTAVTGGPGTGKTTIVKAALAMFGAAGLKCMMAAPTGRAAKRLQDATGYEAKTIHRLLEFTYDDESFSGSFRINKENPLDADVVIVDEMSMVDAYLFRDLLRGIAPGTRLVLIGDADQLPSVGPGNVLEDLIGCGCIRTYVLTHRYRNSGRIAECAYEILQGTVPAFDALEFVFQPCRSSDEVAAAVCAEYKRAVQAGEDVQVLAPIKKPPIGSVPLNNMLRETVNPSDGGKAEIVRGEHVFRVGDRVMQIVNDYTRKWVNHDTSEEGEGVFNGDLGEITDIVGTDLWVEFDDGRTTVYELEELDQLDGAFAYTVHKSQGSEFESVILPMNYGDFPFLSRSLLYTAVTRAKKRVTIIGSKNCLAAMVRNTQNRARWTMLKEDIREMESALSAVRAETRETNDTGKKARC